MTAIVFAGPTISAEEVLSLLNATVLPPAGQGDIYRAARQGASVIGLIDGYFEGVPSVWHKEILWALEQGIAVFGSASMGALRAAELSAFGMVGIGDIYEAYAAGEICDDDEVAVLHSPAELGFAPLSEPMVSIRATVARAVADAVLEADQAAELLRTAKQLFYHDRTWEQILAGLADASWLGKFSAWLETGRVDAKREDAQMMLIRMAAFQATEGKAVSIPPEKVERSLAWQGLVQRIEAEAYSLPDADLQVLDELRLEPVRFGEFRIRAAARCLALENARRKGLRPDRQEILEQLSRHRETLQLFRSRDLQQWLAENGLTADGYEALLGETALAGTAVNTLGKQLDLHLLAELRQAGAYAQLKSRAISKSQRLAELDQRGSDQPEQDRLRWVVWYFETRLQRGIPEDLGEYAAGIGLRDLDEFYALIRREFMYHQKDKTQSAPQSRDQAGHIR
ncbi:TfuA domain protein, core [Leisingera sp. HS039]|uniref:TfuA-like protein n=1 Tax=Leisingera sp. HS039 TaxID=2818496 RepID=UPI001B3A1B24|nr:TfuA-like protein [Leisingera sp. HS039]MBQ4825468.1 TfuA domain protein, core [Leisingera sp. HS039]